MASDEELRMSLVRRRHVNTSGMRVIEHTKAGKRDVSHEIQVRDCFLDGPLTDGSGHASVAMCDGELLGSVTTRHQRLYEIVPLPAAKRAEDDVVHVLVTWKRQPESHLDDAAEVAAEDAFDNEYDVASNETSSSKEDDLYTDEASLEKRGSKDVEVEIGNNFDKFWIEAVAIRLNRNSNQQLIDLQILKWSAGAKILKSPSLNWDVTLKLAAVIIMRDDTSFYNAKSGETMKDRMVKICRGTKNEDFDQVALQTQEVSNTGIWGLAWVGYACDSRYQCAVTNRVHTRHWTELHDMSHTLGLNHDGSMDECKNDKGAAGYMGANENVFRDCYGKVFDKSFKSSKMSCLFKSNINGGGMGSWLGKK
jgi:hypothetical protein